MPSFIPSLQNMPSIERFICILLLLVSICTRAFADSSIIVNRENNEIIEELDVSFLLLGKRQNWSNQEKVIIAVLQDDQSVENALVRYTGLRQDSFEKHWNRIAFSGRGRLPKQFKKAKDLIAFVNSNRGAIGLVKGSQYLPGVRIVKLPQD